jgi:hypothetical protein
MLRAIAGAVENTSHAHKLALPENFARGVAKRAVGTLTAQWPDVLASATVIWRQEQGRDTYVSRALRGSEVMESLAKGGRLRLLRRSPIRAIWYMYAKRMFKIRRQGTEEEYQTHCRILRLLDQAQRELDALTSHNKTEGK